MQTNKRIGGLVYDYARNREIIAAIILNGLCVPGGTNYGPEKDIAIETAVKMTDKLIAELVKEDSDKQP